MEDILFKILPMVLSMTLSQAIYLRADLKYKITDKLSARLHIHRRYMAVISLVLLVALCLLIKLFVDMPYFFFFILAGLLTGIAVGMIKR